MTLLELLEKYQVEIPMLQRDYAQGRKSQEKVAREFLDSIFEVLEGNKKSLHIDFVFGYQENNKFLLIDGQQRITTLWLLHFYLYKKSENLEEIKPLLQRFSYSVRKSSRNFCKNLLKKDFDISLIPSKAIETMGSEFEEAENLYNDPTIKAMLHMLDLIYEKTQNQDNCQKFAERLGLITFELFDMENFGLGEELYIKMNARGKQLSRYENLKAFIQKDSKISSDKELLTKIDNDWTDYFFEDKKIEEFDTRGQNFLHYANIFFLLEENRLTSENIEEAIKNLNHAIDEFYQPLQELENIKLLDRTIELFLIFDKDRLSETLKPQKSSFFSSSLSYPDICYFFSILFFVKNIDINDKNKNTLNDWLRVCRHLIENHRLDNAEEIPSFFFLFRHLSRGCDDIYQFLVNNSSYSFHSNIYSLESKKAKFILESRNGGENWEEILNHTSEHKILKGWVDFLLDFSDEEFEYESYSKSRYYESKRYGYNSLYHKPNLEKFKQYAQLTMQILEKKEFWDNGSFQRALLCVGDYSFYSTNWFYGNYTTDAIRDREMLNWLLSGIKNSKKIPYFKKFLDLLLESKKENLKDKMQEIVDGCNLSTKEWWEQLLINKEEFIFEKFLRIRYFDSKMKPILSNIKSVNKVELLPATKSTKNAKDLLDYGFYKYCSKKELNISDYEDNNGQYGKTYESEPHFTLNNKKVLCNSIETKIIYGDEEYLITLKKGTNIFDEFDEILEEIEA
ncbi:DUF262 domain-containing protein [Helicobacter sp. MIT 05-5293]|uniref:DUF262 domain-containing protein n=1 Tax=Helicobacter sp. MIT 05-5293 TaxID=1548149 RepID=UPI00051DB951|nr:DUF262 domain-containing protein [Helicobacter sp. MIT 05-5293]TLD82055.1 DUF262 domain-containing protein [Helicobacter sp. MIT 05-5293]